MKRIIALFFFLVVLFGCGANQSELNNLRKERDELSAQVNANVALIQALRDSVRMLSFPADQRLTKINGLVSSGDYSSAKQEISRLMELFPESKEAKSAPAIVEKVDKLIAQKQAEEERIKALGFKALKASTSATIGYNKVDFSNISVGNTFTFDSYGDTYHYFTADRGNKYFSAAMKVTSEDKDPNLPQPALYSISGDTMKWEGNFFVRFTRWRDYGSYLGNYGDNNNDFSKVSSVNFKVGYESSEEITKKPYAIVLKKENSLQRHYERFDDPPVSYTGSVDYPYSLSLEDFTKDGSQFVVIKIANL